MDIEQKLRIMVIGECWHGSDVTGLARGFRDLGCVVELIGQDQFFPKIYGGLIPRILGRMSEPIYRSQYNQYLKYSASILKPHIILVFKGSHLDVDTLEYVSRHCGWLINFYPDISILNQGRALDVRTFECYDHIFTTKSFGVEEIKEIIGSNHRVTYLSHGCDPNVHRPFDVQKDLGWQCDVSFIGGWSSRKESYIKTLASMLPEIKLKIWGPDWKNNAGSLMGELVLNDGVYGDLYSLAINSSRINLGLLLEKVKGASSGDNVTARTFHIPASGGFMLHQRTSEVLNYFIEGKEMACFESGEELAEKVQYYLAREQERMSIAQAGHDRAMKDHKMSNRASVILDHYQKEVAGTKHGNKQLK